MYYTNNLSYTTDACTNVNMPQPRQLTCLWNKNRVLEYSQLYKTMLFVLIGVIFSLLIEMRNLFCFCSHTGMAIISIVGKHCVVIKVNINKNHGSPHYGRLSLLVGGTAMGQQ